ncbi:uncharacterized protein LOC128198408 [Bicyclus anynana]|uniref:Uncharacterized protein LOC128198408 n=1 Tax=Bicyclus anynana TaxID=110368 RepID=A0ABM3LL30_BICAN|nr:uncharacterized protein LOC128198408 [Bicyclus anynana]
MKENQVPPQATKLWMELAKFIGNILKWYEFWDQFASNVDSRNISDVDKLLYLHSVLEGEAKQAIIGLDTTSKNYSVAVTTLKERYGKASAIIDAHYVALYRIKSAPTNNIKDSRCVLNEIERHLRVLSSLGEDVNHNHLRVMIMEKFPEDLIYEVRMKMCGEDDSIDSIRKNLEYIISARETSSRFKREGTDIKNMERSVIEDKSDQENFTLRSLHARSEVVSGNSGNRQNKFTTWRKDRSKFDNRQLNKFKRPSRKRPYENSDRTNEPHKKKTIKCIFCGQGHFNDECTTYILIQDRKSQLGTRCFICFGDKHKADSCRFKQKCRHCGRFGAHNRALCPTKFKGQSKTHHTDNLHINTEIADLSVNTTTVLQTCLVKVSSNTDSTQLPGRILLDCGSQRSYIIESFVNSLKLPIIETTNLSIFTFGAKSPHHIESPIVNFNITTRTGIKRLIYANVVPHITRDIKTPKFDKSVDVRNDIRLKNLTLADDGSRGDEIDILLGNDYYHSLMLQDKISVAQNLFLVNSDFGWVWSGSFNKMPDKSDQLTVLTYFQSNGNFDNKLNVPDLPLKYDDVKKLWDLESIGIIDSPKSTRDEEAINQFNETIQFKGGRYYVQWPWTVFPPNLHDNLGLAFGRLNSLLKRLDATTIKAYDQVINEQIQSGVVEIVPDPKATQSHPVHYLPHHCVSHRDKPGKLRIVYDASAKIKENHSLNECLYRGPLMLEDLTGLLIKFRQHRIGIVADVEKAFLQLGLQEPDRDVTRFLWLKNINHRSPDNILYLRFCRVPFGVIASPFLLNATIRFHLIKLKNEVAKQLAEDIYVDNIVTCAQTVQEACDIYTIAKQSFEQLSMNLRDWNSNSKELLSHIPNEFVVSDQDRHVKVLGLIWDIDNDSLHIKPQRDNSVTYNVKTKRDVLKVIGSIYDPCGFAVPVMLSAKLFFQKLWKLKSKWDEKLPDELLGEWGEITEKFKYIDNIKMSRYFARDLDIEMLSNNIQYQLHCFTDASLTSYAAVIYLRSSANNNNSVNFVIGKCRLVPLKNKDNLQIPRLELLGVLIGHRLINYVSKILRLQIKAQYLWTDSQIVLSWYKSEKLLPPFVSRRIAEIKQNRSLEIRYVPTKLNPADVGTRVERVESYQEWLKGPLFLMEDSKQWPTHISHEIVQMQTFLAGEGRKSPTSTNNSDETERTLETIQHSDSQTEDILKLQAEYFPKEVGGSTTDLSRVLQLYKDQNGILRCKGRFRYTNLTHDQKEPILLPKNAEFTHNIITELHQKNYHVGVSHTLALLREHFWVPHGRSTVQKVIRKCQQCVKYGGGPFKLPAMPDLPAERVKLGLPFLFTGLDYFGPLYVSEMTLEKRWVCLFTCLTIRAIHMEVVTDLTAQECLLAIRRFVAVRGLPQLILSDNATQFKLTADVLTSDYCIQNNVRWKFIPELAPWFGGFYERLIGLVKHSMKRTLDKHTINHNQLCTVIKELEAVINTRPLTTVGTELEHVLTPTDFLRIGGPVVAQISDRDFLESATATKLNLIEGWKRGQTILLEFTKMFNNQYLTSLRERHDRHRQPRTVVARAPRLSEIVQIKSDSSRAHWKVGRIVELIKGSDGEIRVAKVKLPNGDTLTRSIGHLFPLELDDHDNTVTLKDPTLTEDQTTENNQTSEQEEIATDANKRPSRASAVKAREKVMEWTAQLMINLFEQ